MAQKLGKTTKYLIILWSLYALPLVLFTVIMILIGHGKMGFMPEFAQLENPQTNLATVLITEDGEQLGKYFIENRTFVSFDDLAPHLVDALVATEDVRYFRHSGIVAPPWRFRVAQNPERSLRNGYLDCSLSRSNRLCLSPREVHLGTW